MSIFVLDTDTLTLLQRRMPTVCERAAAHATETAITILTVEEQLSGWYALLRKAKKPDKIIQAYRSLAENVRFLSQLRILDYDEPALQRYEDLKRLKLNIGKFDLRIA
jgi:tRNA(fMet)-specific endonuclease VapC